MTIPWAPYGERQPVSSFGISLITAFEMVMAERWGFGPQELYGILVEGRETLADDDPVHGIIGISAEMLHGAFQSEAIKTFARPLQAGPPVRMPKVMWETDDWLGRIATGTFNWDEWSDQSAPPTHRIFVDQNDLKAWLDSFMTPDEDWASHCDEKPRRPSATSRSIGPAAAAPLGSVTIGAMPEQEDRILRLEEVMKMTRLSRSTIYAKEADRSFPARVKLGARATGWFLSDINAWMADLHRPRSS